MKTIMVMLPVVVEGLLLALPGYCSNWWPVWVQAACLFLGVLGAAAGASLLVWLLDDTDVWKA